MALADAPPVWWRVTPTRQLALRFPQHQRYLAADFIAAPATEEVLTWLARPLAWPAGRLCVFGPQGAGKTHILHVFAERSGATVLPGEAVRHLVDMPAAGGVAVDDADHAPDAEALLHLINVAAERGLALLLAARTAPSHWPVGLPDLASRLRATTAVELGLPDDGLLRALLARLLAQRQLRADSGVQDYLLARLPRHGAALREAVACLDRLSLASGRAVSRALAGEVVARLGDTAPEPRAPDLPGHGALL